MNLTMKISPISTAIGMVLNKYPMVELDASRDEVKASNRLRASIKSPDGQKWITTVSISDMELDKHGAPDVLLIETGFKLVEELINKVPIEVIGAYPFARVWHDHHATRPRSAALLLWHPERDVDGWVFNKAYKMYPRDQSAKSKQPKLKEIPVDDSESKSSWDDEFDQMRKALTTMPATKKKKVIRRAPVVGFDPSKVRAPDCMKHAIPMVFDMVAQKWRCTEDGCRVVARPARDEDDKTVILGKGGLQLRLVAQDGGLSVVLISDDNIALDITKMVDVDEILDTFDVKEQAKVALDSGREIFATPTDKHITLNSRLVVMGATELTE